MFSTRQTTRSHNMCSVSYQWCKSKTTEAISYRTNLEISSLIILMDASLTEGKIERYLQQYPERNSLLFEFSSSAKLSTAQKEAAVEWTQ